MLEHFYQNIAGHCDFYGLYLDALERMPDNATMVEVGTWRGHSLAFLAVQASRYCKPIHIVGVDAFEDSPDAHMAANPTNGEFPTLAEVSELFTPLPNVRLIKGISWEVASQFEDESLDFVFIDADHAFESVTKDLDAWWPKVKKGGIMAGHDYSFAYPGVVAAVHLKFGPCRRVVSSWITTKS